MARCDLCANCDTFYCVVCEDGDFYRTYEQKAYEDYMCDLLCGESEEENDRAEI